MNKDFRSYGFGLKLSSEVFTKSKDPLLDFHLHLEPYQEVYTFGDLYFMLPRKTSVKIALFWVELLVRKIAIRPARNLYDKIFNVSRFSLYLKAEERPNIDSKVEIRETSRNKLGFVVYSHKVSKVTSLSIRKSLREFRARFHVTGIGKITYFRWFMHAPAISYAGPNWHPMGTTPLNLDNTLRVTESDLSLTGHPNIFLLNAGIFPSGSYQNPATTTLAFALKLADEITY
jgi:choline dehydrogenase-like flavoprotein